MQKTFYWDRFRIEVETNHPEVLRDVSEMLCYYVQEKGSAVPLKMHLWVETPMPEDLWRPWETAPHAFDYYFRMNEPEPCRVKNGRVYFQIGRKTRVVHDVNLREIWAYSLWPSDKLPPHFFTLYLFIPFLCETLRPFDEYLLHASSLAEPDGRTVLIPAPSGQGKTTLALALMDGGFHMISDDLTVIAPQSNGSFIARSLLKRVSVREDTLALLPEKLGALKGQAFEDKVAFDIDRVFPGQLRPEGKASLLLFPRAEKGLAEPYAVPLTAAEAFQNIVKAGMYVSHSEESRRHFETLSSLCDSLPRYELHMGPDLKLLPPLVRGLLTNGKFHEPTTGGLPAPPTESLFELIEIERSTPEERDRKLDGWLNGTDPQKARMAALTLGRNAGAETLPRLFPLLLHRSSQVRSAAAESMAWVNPRLFLPARTPASPTPRTFAPSWWKDDSPFWRQFSLFAGSLNPQDGESWTRLVESLADFKGESDRFAQALPAPWSARFLQMVQWSEKNRFRRQMTVALTYQCNIDCPYCYGRFYQGRFKRPMETEDFKRLIRYATEQGFENIALTGGEPSVHPRFGEFLQILRSSGLGCYFATNGLFPEAVEKSLDSAFIRNMIWHINEPETYRKGEWDRLLSNIASADRKGILNFIRYNIHAGSPDTFDFLLKVCRDHHITLITYGLVFPDPTAGNAFIPIGEYPSFIQKAVRLAQACRPNGVKLHAAKPLPLCLVSDGEILPLLVAGTVAGNCTIHQHDGTFNTVVNPDLSLQPCIALDRPNPPLDLGSPFAKSADWAPFIRERLTKPPLERCQTCVLLDEGRCQATCLSYRKGQNPF